MRKPLPPTQAMSPIPGTLGRQSQRPDSRSRSVDDEEVGGRDGDALGLLRGRAIQQAEAPAPRKRTRALGYDDARPVIDFARPVSQARRLMTADGRTSFHFSHSTIRVAPVTNTTSRGTKTGAAASHNSYIEREGAVAVLEVADGRDGPTSAVVGSSAGADAYVARDEAVAVEAGARVIFSNISSDPQVRRECWRKIEKRARKPSQSTLTMVGLPSDPHRAKIRQKPDCPAVLARLIDSDDVQSSVSIAEAKQVNRWLRKQPDFDQISRLVAVHVAREGHIQYRVNGSLPHVLSKAGMVAAVRDIGDEIGKWNLPYVAVLHAPDYHNNGLNWHYHLIYHDRPIKLMPDGRWDFETLKTTTDKRGRLSRGTLAQPKNRAVSKRDWIPNLRDRVAEIVNGHLAAEGHGLRYDPRSNDAMGLTSESQESKGSRADALERQGVATPVGERNAARYWLNEEDRIAQNYAKALQESRAEIAMLQRTIRTSKPPSRSYLAELAGIESHAGHAARLSHAAAAAELAYRKARSRADLVADDTTRLLDAIAAGQATKAEARADTQTRSLQAAAQAHQLAVDRDHASALAIANNHRASATDHLQQSDVLRAAIMAMIGTGSTPASEPAMPAPVEANSPTPITGSASSTLPIATGAAVGDVPPTGMATVSRRQPASLYPPAVSSAVNEALDVLQSSGLRVGGKDKLTVGGDFWESRRVAAEVVNSEPMQARLAGIAAVQKRELKRLKSFAVDHPETLDRVASVNVV